MRSYTTKELIILMEIRQKGYDPELDDHYTSDRMEFYFRVTAFIDWIEKMERKGRVEHLLKSAE